MPNQFLTKERIISISDSPVYFMPIHPQAKIPFYAKDGDAGMDLFSVEEETILPQQSVTISTGLRVKVPEGCVGLVCPRSGLASKHQITVGNSPGICDSGYTGELKVIVQNNSTDTYQVSCGDKIAQFVIVPFVRVNTETLDSFDCFNTERGESGFGSTGKV